MQYHGTLKTADGAYHCPVGSIMAIFNITMVKYTILEVTMMKVAMVLVTLVEVTTV